MDIADLEAWLSSQGIEFVHFVPDEERQLRATRAFGNADTNGKWVHGPYRMFLIPTLAGKGCSHVPVVILEDETDMDPKALAEALLVASPADGNPAMVIRVGKTLPGYHESWNKGYDARMEGLVDKCGRRLGQGRVMDEAWLFNYCHAQLIKAEDRLGAAMAERDVFENALQEARQDLQKAGRGKDEQAERASRLMAERDMAVAENGMLQAREDATQKTLQDVLQTLRRIEDDRDDAMKMLRRIDENYDLEDCDWFDVDELLNRPGAGK